MKKDLLQLVCSELLYICSTGKPVCVIVSIKFFLLSLGG